ncbi:retrovirus-related pol polyprotein from transposon TNT 1-94 [Tanacetum coccineum]
MPEDSRVPIILGRPFLVTARAMIDVFNKKITLRVGDDEVIFDVDQSIKKPPAEDDACYGIDDLDDTINAEVYELLANDRSDSFLLKGLEKSIDQSDLKSYESLENKSNNESDLGIPIRRIVRNRKKCLADASLHVLLDEIKVNKTLCFIKEPVEIMDREIRKLKRRKIVLVKDRWNLKRGPGFTWEHKDQMRIKYPQLLVIPLEMAKSSFCVISYVLFACRDLEAAFEYSVAIICYVLHVYVVAKFFAYFVGKILGGDQLLVILCGYSTKSLELRTSFLSMTMFVTLDRGTRSVSIVILSFKNASIYACSDSLFLTPLCGDDIHDVTPRVSALAGCDIPSITRNLISVPKLLLHDYEFMFGYYGLKVYFNSRLVGTGSLDNNLIKLKLDSNFEKYLLSMDVNVISNGKRKYLDEESSSRLWYKRLGHISKDRMQRLIKERILHHLDFSDFNQCIECIKGKFVKTIKKGSTRSKHLLEIIHTDICGPFINDIGGHKYFITFIDDYSRYTYVYLIKEKSESLDVFKVFKAEVENQLNRKIKIVRSDRGEEYYGKHSDLECFLNEALKTATHILNRVPSKSLPKTSFELWTERSKWYRFYCPNHTTWIVQIRDAEFFENGEISGSGERSIDLNEKLIDAPNQELSISLYMENTKYYYSAAHDFALWSSFEDFPVGYTQKKGIDYNETFSPVSRKDSLRIVMALVAHYDVELHQMDVKTAFLNSDLHEDVYMTQPEGFMVEGDKFGAYQCPKNKLEQEKMRLKPYASIVGSLMYAQFKDSSRSTSGYIFMLSGGPISWRSHKKELTTTFTMMAEYVASITSDVRFSNITNFTRAGLYLETKYLYVRDKVEDNSIVIKYINTHDMLADQLTKGLPPKLFLEHVAGMCLCDSQI